MMQVASAVGSFSIQIEAAEICMDITSILVAISVVFTMLTGLKSEHYQFNVGIHV